MTHLIERHPLPVHLMLSPIWAGLAATVVAALAHDISYWLAW